MHTERPLEMSTPTYPDATVTLTGADGNAFFIIARTRMALRKAGVSADQIASFTKEAESGDYDNVLQTVMRWVTTH